MTIGIVNVSCLLALIACGKGDNGKEGGGGGGATASKPTPGDVCKTDGERVCLSPEQQAICQGGQWRAFPCAGANACASRGGTTTCDISGNKTDDGCAAADNKKNACASGGKERVSCVDGKIKREMCRGPMGCSTEGDAASCDMSINLVGEPCSTEKSASCTPDQKEYMVCRNGQWISSAFCRGPKGCYLDTPTNKMWCDQSLALKGDTCLYDVPGACTPDGKAEIICKNGKWAIYYAGGCRK